MANNTELKNAIAQVIKANDNQEITGQVLQNTLNNIISSIGSNATFAGIAIPTTSPGNPDQNVFYFAVQAGTYVNFGGLEIKGGFNIIKNNTSGNWVLSNVYELVEELGDSETAVISQKAVTTELVQLHSDLNNALRKDELNRIGKDFPIKGVVKSNGEYVEYALSPYSMNKAILVKNGESFTFVGYGSTTAAAMALYGDAQLSILWKTIPYTSGVETNPQSVTFNNKTGRTIHVILSTKNASKSYYFYGTCQTNEISFEDIYHERGVFAYSTKTYIQTNSSPYTTYFVPVTKGQILYTHVGTYNSTYRIWACNKNREYIDSPINKRGDEGDPSVLCKLSVVIPDGVSYVAVTNRTTEHTDIDIQILNNVGNHVGKEYNLTPQQGMVSFIVDGGYNQDEELKELFDEKGVKAGWALLYPFVNTSNHGMGEDYARYLAWQNEGHEIDVHSGQAQTYNGIDYTVPYTALEQKEFAAMRHKEFSDIGFIPRAFVQLGSQHGGLPTEASRKPIYYSFEFGFTRATNSITEPNNGAVMMPTDKPWNLGRSTLEVITLDQMKGLIDECAEKKSYLCIYCHSWRIGDSNYSNQTWDNMASMIDYAKSKCVVDTPYNCVKALYANHIE